MTFFRVSPRTPKQLFLFGTLGTTVRLAFNVFTTVLFNMLFFCFAAHNSPYHFMFSRGMPTASDMSPRRLSDISPQLQQLTSLVVENNNKEALKASRSMADINSTSIEERILRITGYYGFSGEEASSDRAPLSKPDEFSMTSSGSQADVSRVSGSRRLRFSPQVVLVHLQQALWGVAVTMCVCCSWCGANQLAKVTLRRLNAPLTITWFSTSWNCLLFPLYYLGHLCCSAERQSPRQRFRECCRFLGDEGLTKRVLVGRVVPFGLLWTLTCYLYLQGLRLIPPTDASALFCCCRAFVFLLSWVVLRQRFLGVRIVAAILSIAGIVMMTYADGFHSYSVFGIALVVASACMAALYKVLFRLFLGSAKLGEAALYLSVLGGANLVFVGVVPLLLLLTGAEELDSLGDVPWACLCGASALLLVFTFLMNFGALVTLPTLISLGVVLSVPVNAVVDRCASEVQFNSVRVIALLVIGLGFLLLLLPEDWDQSLLQLCAALHHNHQPTGGAKETCTETTHVLKNCPSKPAPEH
ncbi:putative thiamine transporter SLC35F3a [Clupea harengus]|uniref:Thiamine transporter SLC35F3a n=1 Tax=Clupea harengus TaxID=7950 RepID=A0A6P8GUL2_CLUHA|nr:putative thiamine transporter SLC35F3a [Clupea harengus]